MVTGNSSSVAVWQSDASYSEAKARARVVNALASNLRLAILTGLDYDYEKAILEIGTMQADMGKVLHHHMYLAKKYRNNYARRTFHLRMVKQVRAIRIVLANISADLRLESWRA